MAESNKYRAIRVLKFGEPVVIETLDIPKPSKNQVLVKIHYAPINPVDVIILKGHYPDGPKAPLTIGMEGSGVIVDVGPELQFPHKIGERVAIFGFSGVWAEYGLFTSDQLVTVDPENTLEEAASSFANPATILVFVEEEVVKGGHKAVVHSVGASSAGKQLIRELKERGIKSINLVRKDEYIPELKAIGADYVLNIKDADFEANLKKIAAEEQATIALDPVGGELTGKIFGALPPKSHLLIYGGLSNSPTIPIPFAAIWEGKVLRLHNAHHAFVFGDLYARQELGKRLQKKLKTTFQTHVQKIFAFEEIKQALEYFEGTASQGKILLKF